MQQPSPRGANFTGPEYAGLARAWMHVSENSVTGADQKGSKFHKAIHEMYNTEYRPKDKVERPFTSIMSKSKDLHKECFRFAACVLKVGRMKVSGVSEEDIVKLATGLYNNMEVRNPKEDCGPAFKFIDAYNVFRKHEKFMSTVESGGLTKASTKSFSNETSGAVLDVGSGDGESDKQVFEGEDKSVSGNKDERPMGRRKAKDFMSKWKHQEEKLRVAQSLVETQKQRNETLKRQLDLQLFQSTAAGFSQEQTNEFFSLLREEALQELRSKRRKRATVSPNTETVPDVANQTPEADIEQLS